MGSHSPAHKRRKRKQQKVRRKLKFSPDKQSTYSEDNCEQSSDILMPNDVATSEGDIELDKDEAAYGEDITVLEMHLEDSLRKEDEGNYDYQYLLDCRKKLCRKVQYYRRKLEESVSANIKQALEHRKELESVRTFYHNIAYARTRTGQIVKSSLMNSSAAMALMKQISVDLK